MKKIILSSVAILLVAGIAGGVYWWLSRPQVIKFSDESKLILLGADYGKRHTVPGGKLPKGPVRPGVANRAGGSTFTTATDTLVVWVRANYDYTPTQPVRTSGSTIISGGANQNPNFQFYVYDPAGTACGNSSSRNVTGQRGDDVLAFTFNTSPRREGKLVLRAQESYGGGQEMSDGQFLIANPSASKTFQKWTAEPMPNKKSDGDLAVTLTKLAAGAALPYTRNQDNPDDAMNKGMLIAYRIERNGRPVTTWSPASMEITDATGNRTVASYGVNGANQVKWKDNEGTLTFANSLWPDEPAWRLRLQMTQNSDFSDDEQWTATNIPVVFGTQQSFIGAFGPRGRPAVLAATGPGGSTATVITPPAEPAPCAEGDLNGHHIKIFPVVQFTNMPANAPANYSPPLQAGLQIQIEPGVLNYATPVSGAPPPDNAMTVSLAKVTDGQGGDIQFYTYSTGNGITSSTYRFMLRDTAGVTNITASIALHKSRFFEFTVKPGKADADQN